MERSFVSAPPPTIVLGGGGHAKVLIDLLQLLHWEIMGFTDLRAGKHKILGVSYLGTDDVIAKWQTHQVQLVNGVGSIATPSDRTQIFERFKRKAYGFPTVVHPSATVSSDTFLDEGVQIMAGAVVQAGCHIGQNAIINTRASVDHDCELSAHVHIAPGAVLSGGVRVAERAHVGAGATVIQGVTIGADAIVGAGAVVITEVPRGVTVVGVPAAILQRREFGQTAGCNV